MSTTIKTILVVDDDRTALALMRAALEMNGLEIHAETDPRAGLKFIRESHPQIVLLDLIMPGVQGMELLEQIVEVDPGIDVILMTGYYSTESAVEAIQKGASDYLPKPCSIEKLRQRVLQPSPMPHCVSLPRPPRTASAHDSQPLRGCGRHCTPRLRG